MNPASRSAGPSHRMIGRVIIRRDLVGRFRLRSSPPETLVHRKVERPGARRAGEEPSVSDRHRLFNEISERDVHDPCN